MSRAEREFYQVRNYAASLSPEDRAIFMQGRFIEMASRRIAAAQIGAAIAQSSAIMGAGLIQAGAINSAIRSTAPTPFMHYMNGYQARQMNSQVHQMNSQLGDINRNVRDIQFRTRGW
jgi:hypothetical protein